MVAPSGERLGEGRYGVFAVKKKLIHIGALQRRVSYNGAPYKPLYFTYNINSADNAIQHSFIYV